MASRSRVGSVEHNKLSFIHRLETWKALTHSATGAARFSPPISCGFLVCVDWKSCLAVSFFYANLININCAVSRRQKRTKWQRQLKFKCSLHFFFVTWRQTQILHYPSEIFDDNIRAGCWIRGSCGFAIAQMQPAAKGNSIAGN
jgi:hypothetical protein